MSQTLTKPILLDETGQAIAGKLDTNSAAIIDALEDIKDAVSMGTDFVPVMIKVTTPPAKVAYIAGESLDLSGIVVSLIASNGVHIDVTDQCTFVPANGTPLTSANTSIAISYYWYKDDVTFTTSYPIGVKSLASIAITTPPTVTEYIVGEELDLTGIVVTATYDDGTFLDVTQNCSFSPVDGTVLTTSNDTITATYIEGNVTKTATTPISVSVPVYGAEWDGTATSAWTRTDSAANFEDPNPYYSSMSDTPSSPFDTIQPWAGMTRLTDTYAGELVAIPKFYYKLTQNANAIKVQIVPSQYSAWALENGYHISPAHMDRGDNQGERDVIYVGRYHCDGSTHKSKTGLPLYGQTLTACRNYVHALDSDVWQWDFATKLTIWLLYLVEFADWNSQGKIGYGCSARGSLMSDGYTDSMPYHTGTTAATKTTFGGTQYRYIEGLWDNIRDFIDGCYYDSQKHLRIILKPSDFSNVDDLTGGVSTEIVAVGSSDEPCPTQFAISDVEGVFPLFVPSASTSEFNKGDNADVYSCDYWELVGGYVVIGGGNIYNNVAQSSLGCGMFYMDYTSYDIQKNDVGTRLMKLPNS